MFFSQHNRQSIKTKGIRSPHDRMIWKSLVLLSLIVVEGSEAFSAGRCGSLPTPASHRAHKTKTSTSSLQTVSRDVYDDVDAKSAFGTRRYWDELYTGMGDFPKDEYSWYCGWDAIKPYLSRVVPPNTRKRILVPGIGNDPILVPLWKAGYRNLVAFDYSEHAIERQQDLLWFEGSALADSVELHQLDARSLPEQWTDSFDVVLEKGVLDAIYLSGDEDNLRSAVGEMRRVSKETGGILVSVSGVVPNTIRRELFPAAEWTWIRDGAADKEVGCFIFQSKPDN